MVAFEAAARYESIKRAADELALTESAISRQISQLEQQLGTPLFNRAKKRLSLTRAGSAYARDVAATLNKLERDTLNVMTDRGLGGELEIAALPTVGSLWLIPRLTSFYARYPDATVSVSARSTRFLFDETEFDGALGFGDANWPGARSVHLFDEELVAVASPRLLAPRRSRKPAELLGQRLLHLKSRPNAWQAWCEAAALSDANFMRGPRFEVQSMLIGAACAGLGVALLPRFLIDAELRSGTLRIVSGIGIRSEGAYYFSYPERKSDEPALVRFRDWLVQETKLFRKKSND